MNRFDIEQILSENEPPDFVNHKDSLKGGHPDSTSLKDFQVADPDVEIVMQTYEPITTRPIMSKFEFVGALTTLALYLKSKTSLEQYTDVGDIFRLPNTAEIAFQIIKNKKMDVIIKRNHGAELVSFSKLQYNPQWMKDVEEYFVEWNASVDEELYKPLSKLLKK